MDKRDKGERVNPYGDPREINKWRMLRFFVFVAVLLPLLWLTRGEDDKKSVPEPAKQDFSAISK